MIFRYVIKDVVGNHWEFTSIQPFINFRECFVHVDAQLNGRFSGGEIVSIRRVFQGRDKHAPIPQPHRPSDIAGRCGYA